MIYGPGDQQLMQSADLDLESRNPAPGLYDSWQFDDWLDEESRLSSTPLSSGNLIALDANAVRVGFNEHFHEQSILVFTRASPGTYADQASDWKNTIDLGLIVSEVVKEVELYNSHRGAITPDEPQSLDAISIVNGDGVTVVAGETLPFVLNEYDNLFTDIIIDQDGPPTLDAIVTFEISPDEDGDITFTGTRVNVFAFCPQRDPEEIIKFGTDIFEGRDGHEQRHAYRVSPVVTHKYSYKMEDPERLAMMNKIMGNGARLWVVPTFFETEKLSADLSAGVSVIPVDTRFSDYRDDGTGLVILWRAWNDFETAPILSFTDTDITIVNPLLASHTALETLVMPAHPAFIDNRIRIRRQKRAVADFSFRFRLTDGTPRTRMLDAVTPNTYQGLPIIEDPNFMQRTLNEGITQDFEIIESGGGGVQDTFRPRIIVKVTSRKTWIVDGSQGRWDLRGLMHHLKGRRNAFYISTAAEDFIPVADLVSATNILSYSPNEYTENIMNLDPRRDIEVVLKDGTILRRRITDSADDGETSGLLTLDTTWPSTITPDEVDRISLVVKVRLDTDSIVMTHKDSLETVIVTPTVEILQ